MTGAKKLLLSLRYDGRGFCGYQVQPNGRTVQAELCRGAEACLGFPCDVTGCSRTDSGVHAEQFCAALTRRGTASLDTTIPVEKFPIALNRFLPDDIAIRSAMWVAADFHPRYDVCEKEYRYLFLCSPLRDPFWEGRAYRYPRPIDDAALAAMRDAAAQMVGRHDFAAMMAQGSPVSTTVRTVTRTALTRQGEMVEFRVAADGFLYNMVRIMAGTLLAVAEGRIAPQDIPAILASRDRARAGATLPACGLYLSRVIYPFGTLAR